MVGLGLGLGWVRLGQGLVRARVRVRRPLYKSRGTCPKAVLNGSLCILDNQEQQL